MAQPAPFTHNGVTFQPLESQGAYYGVGQYEGKDYLAFVPMMQDGSPDTDNDGQPNVGEVSNFDERWELLDEVNALLGTSFLPSAFPGR